jgi:hypothetical protein
LAAIIDYLTDGLQLLYCGPWAVMGTRVSLYLSETAFPSSLLYGFRSLFRYAFVCINPFDDFIEEIKLFLLYGAPRDLIVFHYYYVRMKNKGTRLWKGEVTISSLLYATYVGGSHELVMILMAIFCSI